MTSIGDRLRRERLRRGLGIEQVAEQTKINASMLEAIEADDLEKLPGSFFTRSFVRQYARALGLDDVEIDQELKRQTGLEELPVEAPEPERPSLGLPPVTPEIGGHPQGRHSFRALFGFIAILGLCTLLFTLWQQRQRAANAPHPAAVATAPHEAQKPAAVNTPPANPAPEAAVNQPAPTPEAQKTPEPQTPAAAPPASAPTSEQGAPASESGPKSSVPEGETAEIHLQVHVTAEVWVRVKGDDKVLFEGLLKPEESRTFEGKAKMSARVGDPGAVEVTWNGKPVGEIGPKGQPRTVLFTPQSFRVAVPPAPAPPQPAASDAL